MTVRVLRADERSAVPWKNGGGLTREVASAPSQAGMSDFVWRVSLADVAEPGPFSRFEGVDRIITLVDGPGMVLTVEGTSHTVAERYAPFPFSGEATTDCRLLGGPLVDFNVMVRRGRATAHVEIVRDWVAVSTTVETTLLAVVLDGSAVFEGSGVVLDRFDGALITDDVRDEALKVTGVAALVTFTSTVAGR
ncbi:HutD/Ves family protein [Streptomyces pseudovenezuelae]|uniref:Environmental stress-induced protein Ves n=1 Tax=Streptomyces pseudovenezuelae TaxID=67350 RepID=A0ABT6LTJ3_9ACTN|nr:HutD family protein [Streptomyces pseudovenezuelae]MDH6219635.1 environmental stress-induced protein Ves [Streptomyces pseudovenezuelae]